LPAILPDVEAAVASALSEVGRRARADGVNEAEITRAWCEAGFTRPLGDFAQVEPTPRRGGDARPGRESAGLWFERPPHTPLEKLAGAFIIAGANATIPYLTSVDETDKRIIDYAVSTSLGFPTYLGGPFALTDYLGDCSLRGAS
jgi:hypothetical protein